MNDEWLVDNERESQEAEAANWSATTEGHKDKHQNNEVPIPTWPFMIIIPLAILYGHYKRSR